MRIFLFSLFITFVTLLGSPVSAQFVIPDELDTVPDSDAGSAVVNGLSLSVTPTIPAPGQAVSAEIRDGYGQSLGVANISWFVNGVRANSGVGETRTSFNVGDAGTTTTLRVVVESSGTTRETSRTFRTAEVDLIWSADTYTPPFYKGKALFTPESRITIAAIPNFPGNRSQLTYTWREGNRVLGSMSGVGRNTLSMSGSILGTGLDISVEVSNQEKTIFATARTFIQPQNVDLVLYEESPLFGTVYEQALSGNYRMNVPEITLRAVPFNISRDSLRYNWSVNGKYAGQTSDTITLRPEGSGRSELSISLENLVKVMQRAGKSIIINFE